MEFLSPGHYKGQLPPGVATIRGVSVGTVALIGETERGPMEAQLLGSWSEYVTKYGGRKAGSFVAEAAYAVWRTNPNAQVIIQRVAHYTDPTKRSTLTALVSYVTIPDRQTTPEDTVEIRAISPGIWGDRLSVVIEDSGPELFRIVVMENGDVVEIFNDLSMDPDHERYAPRHIDGRSNLIRCIDKGSSAEGSVRLPEPGIYTLMGGSDGGPVSEEDYIGDKTAATGVWGFDKYWDQGLVMAAPGITSRAVLQALNAYAEERFDSFAVFDPPEGASHGDIRDHVLSHLAMSTDFAALYWPRVWQADPFTGVHRLVPPSGFILGAYTRTDAATGKGPWKVAAGVEDGVLSGVVGLETEDVNRKVIRDLIYPAGVNPIMFMPGYGIVAYGARTLARSGKQLQYINQRRTFNYVSKSIDMSTQWVEFMNNDSSLWKMLTKSISGFLNRTWKQGAFKGDRPELAYVVKIDEENNPPSAVAQGILTGDIGLAVQTPAEFVFFRYRKHTLAEELETSAGA